MSDNEATDDTTAEIDALAGALDTTSLAPADAGEAAPTLFAAAADAGSAGEASDDEDVDEMPFMDDEDAMPPAVLARVLLLRKLHDTKASLVDEFKKKRKDLEREFQAALAPHDAKRLEVVSGDCDVNLSKEADGGDLSDDIVGKLRGEEEDAEGPLEGSEVLGVPDFWLTTMLRHELVMQMVEEDDVHALKALKDVKIVENADMDGFSIEFFFGANPYFDNAVLTKKYSVPNLLDHEEPILDDVAGTAIKWKTGMNLCVKQIKKKQTKKRGREAGKTRIVTKNVRVDSFFNFFTAPTMPEEAEDDEDLEQEVMEAFESDYQLANAFRMQLIPNAVMWFTGEAREEDDDDEDDEDDEDFDGGAFGVEGVDDDDDSEDDDDEDGDRDRDGAPVPKDWRQGPGGGAPPGEGDPECKQS